MSKKPLALLTAIGLIATASPALAALCDCGPGPQPPAAHMQRPGQPGMPPFTDGRLNLTAEQKQVMDEIMEEQRVQTRKLADELMQNRSELMKLADAETFDEASARTVAERIAKLETDLTVLRMKTRFQLNNLLSEEQKALLQQAERPEPHGRPLAFGPPLPPPGMGGWR